MSSCELKIVLERSDRTCAVGEKVSGTIQVRAESDCECRKLTLTRQWRIDGKGHKDAGKKEEQVIFQGGSWRGGESASYPFAFDAPPGPLTYAGEIVKIRWHLRASADIPGALDPHDEEELVLVAGKSSGEIDLGPKFRPAKVPEIDPVATLGIYRWMMGPIFFVFGVLMAQDSIRNPKGHWILSTLFGAFLGLIGGANLLSGIRQLLASWKLGRVSVEVSPSSVRPGESLTCTVRLNPRTAMDLTEATATLQAREVSSYGKNSYKHTAREVSVPLASGRALAAGESVVLQVPVPVPADAPSTFVTTWNAVHWLVEIRLSPAGFAKWERYFPVTVRP